MIGVASGSSTLQLSLIALSLLFFSGCADSTEQGQAAGERHGALTLTLFVPEPECDAHLIEEDRLNGAQVAWLQANASDIGTLGRNVTPFNRYWIVQDTLAIQWIVTGGQPPYQVTIDGYTRGRSYPYDRASGTAMIPCVLNNGNTSFESPDRWHPEPGTHRRSLWSMPIATSGSKTIYASAVDSDGVIATAAVDVYVLSTAKRGDTLRAGESYEVWYRSTGFRFYMPVETNLRFDGFSSTSGNEKHSRMTFTIRIGNSEAWVSYAIHPHSRRTEFYCPGDELYRDLDGLQTSEAQTLANEVFDRLTSSVEVLSVPERERHDSCDIPVG